VQTGQDSCRRPDNLIVANQFRPFGFLRRALISWLLAYLPFLALALWLFNPASSAQWDAHSWRTVFMFLVPYTGLPMVLLAILVAFVTSTRSARR